jgi:hypothetical protein
LIILSGKWRILNKPTTTSSDKANKTLKCICVSHNTVVKREGLDEASVLVLENFQDSFSPNHDEPEGLIK